LSFVLLFPLGYSTLPTLVAGTALASTSIGMCLQLLSQKKQLDTALGQLISTAAMIDDVISLIILSILSQQTKKGSGAAGYTKAILRPIGTSLVAVGIGVACMLVVPILTQKITRRKEMKLAQKNLLTPDEPSDLVVDLSETENTGNIIVVASAEQNEEVHPHSSSSYVSTITVMLMLVLGATAAVAVGEAGSSYLLGAYVAGMAFSSVHSSNGLWEQKVLPVGSWLSMIFFSSIGFLIPIKHMFSSDSLGYGVLFAGMQVLGKLVCGLFAVDIKADGWIVGWGMVARGELGFVLASQSLGSGIISSDLFVIIVWALFLTSLLAPFPFSYYLSKRQSSSSCYKSR